MKNPPVSIDEYELAGFFGALPRLLDEGIPWLYNDAVYESADQHTAVSFAITPAVKDVRLQLTQAGVCLFEFHGAGVEDIQYHSDKGRESLEVIVGPGHSLWLVLKPRIVVREVFGP